MANKKGSKQKGQNGGGGGGGGYVIGQGNWANGGKGGGGKGGGGKGDREGFKAGPDLGGLWGAGEVT